MPIYLLYWEMINISIARGDVMFDLRGVPGVADNSKGLYRIKNGFVEEYTEFLG